jgi:hypothetical protein
MSAQEDKGTKVSKSIGLGRLPEDDGYTPIRPDHRPPFHRDRYAFILSLGLLFVILVIIGAVIFLPLPSADTRSLLYLILGSILVSLTNTIRDLTNKKPR